MKKTQTKTESRQKLKEMQMQSESDSETKEVRPSDPLQFLSEAEVKSVHCDAAYRLSKHIPHGVIEAVSEGSLRLQI